MGLNPNQEEVANHFESRALVIAGPGSGKTSTITARIGRLLLRQVPPPQILCITFTNKAAEEMRERIEKQYTVGKKIHICTFHALCVELLRTYGQMLGYTRRFTILDSDEQEELMAQVARQKYADHPDVEITKPKIRTLLTICNNWRENMESQEALEELVEEEKIAEAELAVIYEYLERMRRHNQVDFSGLLSETVRLLRTHQPDVPAEEQVLAKLHRQYRFIQVDEYQDTNAAQNELVELLAGPSDNVVAVGDQDQSIYEWRGANPEGMATFINRGKAKRGCKTFKLSVNYRSTPEIIAAADKLIRHCANRIPMEFAAARPSEGKPPRLDAYFAPEDEANGVAEKVQALINLRRVPPQEIAIFYRLNDMSRPIETALSRRQIPYKVVGGQSFYDRAEIKDCVAMLRLLCNPQDGAAFARIANKPKRGIGEKAIGLIENYAAAKGMSIVAACAFAEEFMEGKECAPYVRQLFTAYGFDQKGKSVADCLSEAVTRSNYKQHLLDHEKEDKLKIDERIRNVDEMINSIALFCQDRPGSTIETYLQYVALLNSFDDHGTDDAVRLMSLHASKGLEFDVVFMAGVENGMLPHKKAVDERPDVGLNEERRLCYVGMTRARKQLFISFCWQRQAGFQRGRGVKYENRRPSQFLVEAGLMTMEEYNRRPPKTLVS